MKSALQAWVFTAPGLGGESRLSVAGEPCALAAKLKNHIYLNLQNFQHRCFFTEYQSISLVTITL